MDSLAVIYKWSSILLIERTARKLGETELKHVTPGDCTSPKAQTHL